MPALFGGDEEIRTLAHLAAPTGFRIRTLQPLGYISVYCVFGGVSPNKHIIAGKRKKSRLFGKRYNLFHFAHNTVIIFLSVGDKAVGAIFYAVIRICKIAAAVFTQSIKRAVAENTVKIFGIVYFVAGEVFTFFVLKKFIIIHRNNLRLVVK